MRRGWRRGRLTLGAHGRCWEPPQWHAAHYLGFVLVPLAAFLVGVCEYDLLHAGYLAQLLAYFLSSTARLEPAPGDGCGADAEGEAACGPSRV